MSAVTGEFNDNSTLRSVLFCSYPKTGSTILPSILDRWLKTKGQGVGEMFTWGKGKHNFLIHGKDGVETLFVKTHHSLNGVVSRLRQSPPQMAGLSSAVEHQGVNFFYGEGCGIIYMMRNPVAVLFSAINYAKLLYARDEVRSAWMLNGKAERFFLEMLGLGAIPNVSEFSRYELLNLPESKLESVLWRYIDAWGAIPVLDPDESFGYFRHVNYYIAQMEKAAMSCLLTYEGVMANDSAMLTRLAALLSIPLHEVKDAWGAEQMDRSAGRGRYVKPFFRNFQLSTPHPVKSLAVWPRMRMRILDHCPSLAQVTD